MRPVKKGAPIGDILRPGVVLSTCTCGGGEFITSEIYVASRFDLSILFFWVPTGYCDRCRQYGDFLVKIYPPENQQFSWLENHHFSLVRYIFKWFGDVPACHVTELRCVFL